MEDMEMKIKKQEKVFKPANYARCWGCNKKISSGFKLCDACYFLGGATTEKNEPIKKKI